MSDDNNPLISGFDLDALKLPQNFGEALGVKKKILRVPVRKPLKTDYFRVRVGPSWRYETMILVLAEENETYILLPELWSLVPELIRPAALFVGIDRRNNVFLIPVPLPGPDGKHNSWHQSLLQVIGYAENSWVRAASNQAVGGYDILIAEGQLAEPDWPDLDLKELLEIAFRNRIIDSEDHPVIQKLLGRA
jgi:hypothetical protein